MTLKDATEYAEELMGSTFLGVNLEKCRWEFSLDKSKSWAGLCDFNKKKIYLSSFYISHFDRWQIRDILLHEIAHAVASIKYGDYGHGKGWKKVCVEIGAKPSRFFKLPETIKYKWEIKIKSINKVVKRYHKLPSCFKKALAIKHKGVWYEKGDFCIVQNY